MPHNTSKKDNSVSSVIGTIFLLALVVVAGGVIAVAIVSNISSSSELGPISTLEVSADGKSIYNAGGDVLYRSNLFVYKNGKEIEKLWLVGDNANTYDWAEWKTGQAIRTNELVIPSEKMEDLSIVYVEDGKSFALFTGSSYQGAVPTIQPTPQPTIQPPIPTNKFTVTLYIVDVNGKHELEKLTDITQGDNLGSELRTITTDKDGKFINGWWKQDNSAWNFLTDTVTSDIELYAVYQNEPYFAYGTTDKSDKGYKSTDKFVDAVNEWKSGTILKLGDNKYIICKDIPLKSQSLTFNFNDNPEFEVSEYLITTPDSLGYPSTTTKPVIWASSNTYTGGGITKSLIDIKSGTLNFISGNVIVDGNSRMKETIIIVENGATLIVKDKLEVLNGKFVVESNGESVESGSTETGAGIYNAGTISGGSITVSNCEVSPSTFTDSKSNIGGGGIYNAGNINVNSLTANDNSVTIKIDDYYYYSPVTFSNIGGGGIYNGGTINVNSLTANDNSVKIDIVYTYTYLDLLKPIIEIYNDFSNIGGGGIYNSGSINALNGISVNGDTNNDGKKGLIINFINSNDNHFNYVGGGGLYNSGYIDNINTVDSNIVAIYVIEASGSSFNCFGGGGILNYGGGKLEYNGKSYNRGTIDFISGSVSKNEVDTGNVNSDKINYGGGILNTNKGSITITGEINDNKINAQWKSTGQYGNGGGIFNDNGCILSINYPGKVNNNVISLTSVVNMGTFGQYGLGGGICNRGVLNINKDSTDGNVEIIHNTAISRGGGIEIDSQLGQGTATINKAIIKGNKAGAGGGVHIWGNRGVANNIISSKIIGNMAVSYPLTKNNGWSGGGVYSDNSLTITSTEISNNYCVNLKDDEQGGAGILVGNSKTVTLSGEILISGNYVYKNIKDSDILYSEDSHEYKITGNTYDKKGGGIFVKDGKLNIYSGAVVNINDNKANDGGGIYNDGEVTVSEGGKLTVSNNNANNGGGIYNDGEVTVSEGGKLTVSNNNANNGGGIYNADTITNIGKPIDKGDGPVSIYISENNANNGGGIYNAGTISNGNRERDGGPIFGKWVYNTHPYIEISNNKFSDGSGIYDTGDIFSWGSDNNYGIYGTGNTAHAYNDGENIPEGIYLENK